MTNANALKTWAANATRFVAAFLLMVVLGVCILWVAGYNFDGTWDDPFLTDHPENFTRPN